LVDDVTPDPRQSSFYKALQSAGGLLLILDGATNSSGPATPFSRIWCAFEQSVALDEASDRAERMLLDIATSTGSDVQLITDGIAAVDECHVFPTRGKAERESKFPLELIRVGLATCLEKAQASNETDRVRILNCLAGRDLELTPPLDKHENYTRVNCKLRAIFAVSVWRLSVEKGMVADMQLPRTLHANEGMRSVTLDFTGCQQLDYLNVLALARSFPAGLEKCCLMLRQCIHLGDENAAVLARGLPGSLKQLTVNFNECFRLGDAGLAALASCLPLGLERLNLSFWGCDRLGDAGVVALASGFSSRQRLPVHLQRLKLYLSACERVGDTGAAALAYCLPYSLQELELRFEGCKCLGDAGIATIARRLLTQGPMQISFRLAGSGVSSEVMSLGSDCASLRRWYAQTIGVAVPAAAGVQIAAPAEAAEDDADPDHMAQNTVVNVGPMVLRRSTSSTAVGENAGLKLLSSLKRCASAPF